MKKRYIILLVVAVALLIYLSAWGYTQKTLYDKSCFKPKGGRINKFNMNEADIDIIYKFKNKTHISATISNQDYDVYFNDNHIARVINSRPISIRKGLPVDIPVKVQFSPKEVLNISLNNLQAFIGDKEKARVRLVGKMTIVPNIFDIIPFTINELPIDVEYTLKEILAPSPDSSDC